MNIDLFNYYIKKYDLEVIEDKGTIQNIFFTKNEVKYEMKEVTKDEWQATGQNFSFSFKIKDRI